MSDEKKPATPAIPGYMHEYQPATRRNPAAGEVLPPNQRASWARERTEFDK